MIFLGELVLIKGLAINLHFQYVVSHIACTSISIKGFEFG